MSECPNCGGKSTVVTTTHTDQGPRRRRRCQECDHRWSTIELSVDLFNSLRGMAEGGMQAILNSTKPKARKKGKRVADTEGKERNRLKALRGGIDVPSHLEEDWAIYMSKGYSVQETAEALGLK